MSEKQDRVTQTIDRLISNLPETVIKLKAVGLTSLARQIQDDLDNLVFWNNRGGLVKKDQCDCSQINWVKGPHHQTDCPMFEVAECKKNLTRKDRTMKPIFTECGCEFEKGGWVQATCEHGREFVQGSKNGGWKLHEVTERPTIVCLCGSTRFSEAFQQANLKETLKGNIILTIGCDMKGDDELFPDLTKHELTDLKNKLDVLHFRKIDLADEVLILNVDNYIGESTSRELAYAKALGKKVRFLEAGNENQT